MNILYYNKKLKEEHQYTPIRVNCVQMLEQAGVDFVNID